MKIKTTIASEASKVKGWHRVRARGGTILDLTRYHFNQAYILQDILHPLLNIYFDGLPASEK